MKFQTLPSLVGGTTACCLLSLSLLSLLSNVVVNGAIVTIIQSLQDDLVYDTNGKLVTHTIVYERSDDCTKQGLNTFQADQFNVFAIERSNTDLYQKLFGDESSVSGCNVAYIERGVDRSLADAVMPHHYYPKNDESNISFKDWFESKVRMVELCLINYYTTPPHKTNALDLYWVDKGTPKFHFEIYYGEQRTRCFKSYIGHSFEAYDSSMIEGERSDTNKGTLVGALTVEYTTSMAFGSSPPSDTRDEDHDYTSEIYDALDEEWRRHNRVQRTFSPLGFKKGKLPRDVFASMGAFYYNNQYNKVLEEWGGKGVFVNWWETDIYFIQIPWGIKDIWQKRLLDLVEAWAGVPCEQTMMYGLRQYEVGARLLTHVDRLNTHAVSLIVNVAQGNLTEPWPVEVNDHMDRLHEVIMEPGDIVYYESAKALHGRNRPLMGPNSYYTNLFTHYRPTGDDLWYTRPVHEGTPDPVMEMEGECRLKEMGTTLTPNGQLGIVKGVDCDDKRLGTSLSPTLFKAEGPEDLKEWWRMTSPPEDMTNGGNVRDEL